MARKKQLPVQVDKVEAQLKDFFDMVRCHIILSLKNAICLYCSKKGI